MPGPAAGAHARSGFIARDRGGAAHRAAGRHAAGGVCHTFADAWRHARGKAWLVEKEGIGGDRLEAAGFGERRPVAPNDTDASRQRNRRVSALIQKN